MRPDIEIGFVYRDGTWELYETSTPATMPADAVERMEALADEFALGLNDVVGDPSLSPPGEEEPDPPPVVEEDDGWDWEPEPKPRERRTRWTLDRRRDVYVRDDGFEMEAARVRADIERAARELGVMPPTARLYVFRAYDSNIAHGTLHGDKVRPWVVRTQDR